MTFKNQQKRKQVESPYRDAPTRIEPSCTQIRISGVEGGGFITKKIIPFMKIVQITEILGGNASPINFTYLKKILHSKLRNKNNPISYSLCSFCRISMLS